MLKIKVYKTNNANHELLWNFKVLQGMEELPPDTQFDCNGICSCSREFFLPHVNPVEENIDISKLCANFELISGLNGRVSWYMVNQNDELILSDNLGRIKKLIVNHISCIPGDFSLEQFLIPVIMQYKVPRINGAMLAVIQEIITELIQYRVVDVVAKAGTVDCRYRMNKR